MAGEIKVDYSTIESLVSQIKAQYDSLTNIESSLASISTKVKESWNDVSQVKFDEAFLKMREDTIPQALVLFDTMQTLLETVCSTYQDVDARLTAMIG